MVHRADNLVNAGKGAVAAMYIGLDEDMAKAAETWQECMQLVDAKRLKWNRERNEYEVGK